MNLKVVTKGSESESRLGHPNMKIKSEGVQQSVAEHSVKNATTIGKNPRRLKNRGLRIIAILSVGKNSGNTLAIEGAFTGKVGGK